MGDFILNRSGKCIRFFFFFRKQYGVVGTLLSIRKIKASGSWDCFVLELWSIEAAAAEMSIFPKSRRWHVLVTLLPRILPPQAKRVLFSCACTPHPFHDYIWTFQVEVTPVTYVFLTATNG